MMPIIDSTLVHNGLENVTSSKNNSDDNPLYTKTDDHVQTSTDMNPCPENPRYGEILSQNNLTIHSSNETSDRPLTENLVNDHVHGIPNTVNVTIVASHKETFTCSNVVSNVMTSLTQNDVYNETTHDNPCKESKSKSVSKNDDSQQKSISEEDKELRTSDREGNRIVTGTNKYSSEYSNSGSKENIVTAMEKETSEDDDNVTEKDDDITTQKEDVDCSEKVKCHESADDDKDQNVDTLNVEDLESDDEPIGKRLTSNIINRLKKRKGKNSLNESQPSNALNKSNDVDPTKGWSKVSIPATKNKLLKRKEMSYSDSDYEVEQDVIDIVPPIKIRTARVRKIVPMFQRLL